MLSLSKLDSRVAMSGALDGVPVQRSSAIHLLYTRMIAAQLRWYSEVDCALDALPGRSAGVIPSRCDPVGSLVRMAGARVRQLHLDRSLAQHVDLIVAGCTPHLPAYLPEDFFQRGGVLVTSDRSILGVPQVAGLVRPLSPGSPGRIMLDIHADGPWIGRKVHLAAGHIPIVVDDTHPRVKVIASDKMTGDPVVVAIRIDSGWLLHSVAHWFQDDPYEHAHVDVPVNVLHHARQAIGSPALVDAVRAMTLSLLTGLRAVLCNVD